MQLARALRYHHFFSFPEVAKVSIKRTIAIIAIYLLTCVAWVALGGITSSRTSSQRTDLRDQVASLWGQPHVQSAPSLRFRAIVPTERGHAEAVVISKEEAQSLHLSFPDPTIDDPFPGVPDAQLTQEQRTERKEAEELAKTLWVRRPEPSAVAVSESNVNAKLGYDPRRKGLVWYSLYDVWFTGEYVYEHAEGTAGYLDLEIPLPTSDALYDGLVFEINGEDQRRLLDPAEGRFRASLMVQPGDTVSFRVAYESRGADQWRYAPGEGVQQLERFRLSLTTDFAKIDFPSRTLSPTSKRRIAEGWTLDWDFASTVTGHGMGMVMPEKIQPGEMSTALIFSAPISLMFFFILLFVVATLQKIEIHPVNYLFLAAAFFSFHLLFSYSADHLTVPWAFAISSAVSLGLVVSYLRLVVSPRFALREAALGQLIYLVGFSLAHFWEGYTGLTVTVMAILTLFILMQATGRLRWAEVLSSSKG